MITRPCEAVCKACYTSVAETLVNFFFDGVVAYLASKYGYQLANEKPAALQRMTDFVKKRLWDISLQVVRGVRKESIVLEQYLHRKHFLSQSTEKSVDQIQEKTLEPQKEKEKEKKGKNGKKEKKEKKDFDSFETIKNNDVTKKGEWSGSCVEMTARDDDTNKTMILSQPLKEEIHEKSEKHFDRKPITESPGKFSFSIFFFFLFSFFKKKQKKKYEKEMKEK